MSSRPTESVWDYPRPPALEPCTRLVLVELAGMVLARSTQSLRLLETSHPPTIYIPFADVDRSRLSPSARPTTYCEFKGAADYLDVVVDGRRFEAVGWNLPPTVGLPDPMSRLVVAYRERIDARSRSGIAIRLSD